MVANEESAQAIEKTLAARNPFGLRVVKSDSDGIFRALGYAIIERLIFQVEVEQLLNV